MSKLSHYTDEVLFRLLAAGDEQALAAIMERYEKLLLREINGLLSKPSLSQEVLSDVMHLLWQHRIEAAQKNNPVAWLFVIAKRRASNKVRDEKRRATVSTDAVIYLAAATTVEAQLDSKELRDNINKALEKLSDREKEIYKMRFMEGLSRKEIAVLLNLSENTVKNHLGNALKSLRKWLHNVISVSFI